MHPPPLPPKAWHDASPLAACTTLGVGGPARHLAHCHTTDGLRRTLAWADEQSLPVFLLGGGSNVLVSDEGFPGVVVQVLDESLTFEGNEGTVLVRAGAGLSWDRLVASAVERGLAGIECLSGIPGQVGGAPIQNIGAYGQEISETLVSVEALERSTGTVHTLSAEECAFGYRTSLFKREPVKTDPHETEPAKTSQEGRFVVTSVTLRLPRHGRGSVRYRDLERRFPNAPAEPPSVAAVRDAVLEIRRSKSMVLDSSVALRTEDDPNRRSAGSFFMNPIVASAVAEDVANRVTLLRGAEEAASMPRYPAGDDFFKLSAAWLIERAGFHRGYCLGPAGLSTRHVLALVNRGGATAQDLLTLAGRVRRRVRDAFGVTLQPEPVFVGFQRSVDDLLG